MGRVCGGWDGSRVLLRSHNLERRCCNEGRPLLLFSSDTCLQLFCVSCVCSVLHQQFPGVMVSGSPEAAVSNYIQRQRHLEEQSSLVELELTQRMLIVRQHHAHYASICDYFVSLLSACADDTLRTVQTVVGNRGTSSSGTTDDARDTSSRRSQSVPNRMIVFSPGGIDTSNLSRVTLSGAAIVHGRTVFERKLENDLADEQRRLRKHAELERKRSEAFIRRGVSLVSRKFASADHTQMVLDKSKMALEAELATRVKRDEIRRKHDVLAKKAQTSTLEKQATRSALMRLGGYTAQSLTQSKREVDRAMRKARVEAQTVREVNETLRENAQRALEQGVYSRTMATELFRRNYDQRMKKALRTVCLAEHEAAAEHAKKYHSCAVEVSWPNALKPPAPPPAAPPLSDEAYARLCGARSYIAATGAAGIDVKLSDIEAAYHLAPAHWNLISKVDPRFDGIAAAAGSILRGPTQVAWK